MRSPAFPPRRPSALLRYILPAAIILFCFYCLSQSTSDLGSFKVTTQGPASAQEPQQQAQQGSNSQGGSHGRRQNPVEHQKPVSEVSSTLGDHPIDRLISAANKDFNALLAKKSTTLAQAADAYRKRRGRHPPPGFNAWFQFAKDNNAIIVEEFWDQIYHDLGPFWAVPAAQIRKEAWDYEMTINIRKGEATAGSDWFWTQIWLKLIKTVEHLLPDMDLALNAMDEPRLVVPFEEINKLMDMADKTKSMPDPKDVITNFEPLPKPGEGDDRTLITEPKNWEGTKPYWQIARRGCPPDSAARKADMVTDFDHPPQITDPYSKAHMEKGFVSNYTLSTDFCHQPDLQSLEGIFIEPLTVSATKLLFPMFGGSKLTVNNEILLPAPMYWNEEERFTGGDDHGEPWNQKQDKVIWRGTATGGKNRETNWKGFQRHRFVSMNNGTSIARAEDRSAPPENFVLPSESYGLKAQSDGKLGEWVNQWADVAFVDLMCLYEMEHGQCNYTGHYFSVEKGMKMAEQFQYKYLPDIDGNSFSGRYLGFLRSTSLPIKATLWREWHDSRLIAWKHFVPMDSRFSDWYGILEYFIGYGDSAPGHDAAAEKIAREGKKWAEKVLRKEDMQVYVLRLLLEYARVSDPRRDKMGFVDDL
ncbi:hypothetical protein DV738_g3180, partial [Chaetothyriales sp. CBS 135597]